MPPPGAGVPWGVLGDISAAQPPFSRVTEVCTFLAREDQRKKQGD